MGLTILGGRFKGHGLTSPKSSKTRPTTSLLRKAVFDMLQNEIEGSFFCDLFAGSGAIGLEAISRGAASVAFAEYHKNTFDCLRQNIKKLQVEKKCLAFLGAAHVLLKKLEKEALAFDIFYIDPPYDIAEENPSSYVHILEMLNASPVAKIGCKLFVENDNAKAIERYISHCPSLVLEDSRHYNATWLHRLIKT